MIQVFFGFLGLLFIVAVILISMDNKEEEKKQSHNKQSYKEQLQKKGPIKDTPPPTYKKKEENEPEKIIFKKTESKIEKTKEKINTYEPKNYVVYLLTNTITKDYYIGMTQNFWRRKAQHFSNEYRYENSEKFLYISMKKDSQKYNVKTKELFEMKAIFSGLNQREAMFVESTLIKNNKPYYNISKEKNNYQIQYHYVKQNNPELLKKSENYRISN